MEPGESTASTRGLDAGVLPGKHVATAEVRQQVAVAAADIQDVQPVHGATTEDRFEADLLCSSILPEQGSDSEPIAPASL